ncbi:MAG: hypothetical protein NW218_16245 [Saprospiraceae bacterium]|nr:hypothetical protein [Saprospiraceae bacterium]
MKQFKSLLLVFLAVGALTMSGCLHIIEDVTFHKNGSGTYKMTLDMSEIKGMMEMMKGMGGDSTAAAAGADVPDNSMGQMGEQLSSVAATIKGVQGISNVVEVNDTASFKFGYSFDFADVTALNRALKIINKDKFESKTDEIYKFDGKNFERTGDGDIGAQMKKSLAENSGEEAENMDMMKTFFADMSYKQVYHFADQKIKKNSNELGVLSDGEQTYTIELKPFNEEQASKKVTVATKLKLK